MRPAWRELETTEVSTWDHDTDGISQTRTSLAINARQALDETKAAKTGNHWSVDVEATEPIDGANDRDCQGSSC